MVVDDDTVILTITSSIAFDLDGITNLVLRYLEKNDVVIVLRNPKIQMGQLRNIMLPNLLSLLLLASF